MEDLRMLLSMDIEYKDKIVYVHSRELFHKAKCFIEEYEVRIEMKSKFIEKQVKLLPLKFKKNIEKT